MFSIGKFSIPPLSTVSMTPRNRLLPLIKRRWVRPEPHSNFCNQKYPVNLGMFNFELEALIFIPNYQVHVLAINLVALTAALEHVIMALFNFCFMVHIRECGTTNWFLFLNCAIKHFYFEQAWFQLEKEFALIEIMMRYLKATFIEVKCMVNDEVNHISRKYFYRK